MAVIHVNTQEFEEKVLRSEKTVLVDFWASWCGPCRMLAPVIEAVAADHPEIVCVKVNVDEEPELAMRYAIASIPAVYMFKNGEPVKRTIGYQEKEDIEAFIG